MLEPVLCSDGTKGFKLLPRHWAVELGGKEHDQRAGDPQRQEVHARRRAACDHSSLKADPAPLARCRTHCHSGATAGRWGAHPACGLIQNSSGRHRRTATAAMPGAGGMAGG